MKTRARLFHGAVLGGVLGMAVAAAGQTPEDVGEKIKAALPQKAYAQPEKPRRVLIFTRTQGFHHDSIPVGAQALTMLGETTGAYEATVSDDPAMFAPDQLQRFDAIVMLNTTGELFDDPALKESLIRFVTGGKGLVGIHAASDCFYDWPEYGRLIGGYFDGHPWHEKVALKVDDPSHPVRQPFKDRSTFEIVDEIYQFRAPYTRDKLRVLLSLDVAKTDMNKTGVHRTDGDFAVSWVREYGRGRVFYCSLGHREEIYWNPTILRHYLAGIQFALGDLEGRTTPSNMESQGWVRLFNGKDLSGWKGLTGDPKTRANMSAEELRSARTEADEVMRQHWKVEDGLLAFDGRGSHLCTEKDYGNFELLVDWKIEPGGDSGIYLRGSPQVQIWDPARWPEGSGGLYNNQIHPSKPLVKADNPVGDWNTFRVKMIGDLVTVHLNDRLVIDHVPLENYWERDKPIYPMGPIELQSHDGELRFKDIWLREISDEEARRDERTPPWRNLLFDSNLENAWIFKPGSWVLEEGALTRKGGGEIWTRETFGDFILELEFKLAPGTNSGIFLRAGDIVNWLHTAIEVQVLDSHGKEKPGKHDCGAVYDCLAPSRNMVRKPGEWNHVVIRCQGPKVHVVMNGEPIIDMDLDRWTKAHENPDGTPNKFNTAYKDMPRVGNIGLQDHGNPVWYRNIRVRPLS